jgi:hypothetical protein
MVVRWLEARDLESVGPPEVRTVAPPSSWLLRTGWKRSKLGLLSIDEIPPAGRR